MGANSRLGAYSNKYGTCHRRDLHVKTAISSRQSNNANAQFKHENYWMLTFHSLPQTISADFVPLFCICLHLLKHNYGCFLILVQSFSACTFWRIVDSFHECQLSSVWSYIFLSNGPEKKPKQNSIHSNKKPKNFAEEPPWAKENLFGALSQGLCADWLVCIAFCIYWHLISSYQLSYFS